MKSGAPTIALFIAIGAMIALGIALFRDSRPAPENPTAVQSRSLGPDAAGPSQAGPNAGEPLRRSPPGSELSITLIEPPATSHGILQWTEADKAMAVLADQVEGVDYDPHLGHAARELAHLHSIHDGLIPTDALVFLLASAGASIWKVRQSFTATARSGNAPILKRLHALVDLESEAETPIRVGIGEAWQIGATLPRNIAILVTRSDLYVDPGPRSIPLGEVWTLSGTLPRVAGSPQLLVQLPGGDIEKAPLMVTRDRFKASIPVGKRPGLMHVELIVSQAHGPTPLAQFTIHVGRGLPTGWAGAIPPDESWIRDASAAADHAFQLLQQDRTAEGLPPLTRDGALDEVARRHSEEMARTGYVGHHSPTSGTPADRLAVAGITSTAHSENIASDATLHAAQSGLMHSLGHRRNILGKHISHVGIGVAARGESPPQGWIVTQLFLRPPHALDAGRDREALLNDLNEARRRFGSENLHVLRAHQDTADRAAAGPSHSLRRFLDDWATGDVVEVAGWRIESNRADDVQWPDAMLESRWERVSLGLAQKYPDAPIVIVALLQR